MTTVLRIFRFLIYMDFLKMIFFLQNLHFYFFFKISQFWDSSLIDHPFLRLMYFTHLLYL